MKVVHLENNIVIEIIPKEAIPVEEWYGYEFAANCKQASDEVDVNWEFSPNEHKYYPPGEKPTALRMAKKEINNI